MPWYSNTECKHQFHQKILFQRAMNIIWNTLSWWNRKQNGKTSSRMGHVNLYKIIQIFTEYKIAFCIQDWADLHISLKSICLAPLVTQANKKNHSLKFDTQYDHILKKFILYKPTWPLLWAHYWHQGHNWNKLEICPLVDTTHHISRI